MNFNEAIVEMKKGKKISCLDFADSEYLKIENNKIIDENNDIICNVDSERGTTGNDWYVKE